MSLGVVWKVNSIASNIQIIKGGEVYWRFVKSLVFTELIECNNEKSKRTGTDHIEIYLKHSYLTDEVLKKRISSCRSIDHRIVINYHVENKETWLDV